MNLDFFYLQIKVCIQNIFNNALRILMKEQGYKKARHPVGLFRIWLLDMTPVVSHDPDA